MMHDISRIVVSHYAESSSTSQTPRHIGPFWRARPVVVQFVDPLYTPSSAAELARQAVSGIAIIDDRYDFDPDGLFDLVVPFVAHTPALREGCATKAAALSSYSSLPSSAVANEVGVEAGTREEGGGGGVRTSRAASSCDAHTTHGPRADRCHHNRSNSTSSGRGHTDTAWKAADEARCAARGVAETSPARGGETEHKEEDNNTNDVVSGVMQGDDQAGSDSTSNTSNHDDEEEEEEEEVEVNAHDAYGYHYYYYCPARKPSLLTRLRRHLRRHLRRLARPESAPLTSTLTSEPQARRITGSNSGGDRWCSAGRGRCVRAAAPSVLDGGYVVFSDSFVAAHPQSRIAALTQAYQREHAATSSCCLPSSWLDVFFASMNKDTQGNLMRRCVREAERGVRPMFRRRPSSLAYGTASYITRE